MDFLVVLVVVVVDVVVLVVVVGVVVGRGVCTPPLVVLGRRVVTAPTKKRESE